MFFSILPQAKILTVACTSPGRRGMAQQSFTRGGSATRYNPLPFYIPFLIKKKYPFGSIPSIDKWCPFHIPSLQLCISFNCCKCTFFMTWINLKPERFLEFSSPKHASVIPSRPFNRSKWHISLPFHILQLVKSLPFYIPKARKRCPFRPEPPRREYCREYPPPRRTRCKMSLGLHS